MSEQYLFFRDGKELTYLVVTGPVRIVPFMGYRVSEPGRKGYDLLGFWLLNGEVREGAIEVPVGKQIFRSGKDLSTSLDSNLKLVGLEAREL